MLGVILEVWFVVHEYLNDLADSHLGIIRSPQRPKLGQFIFELLGAVLVAVGVAGELWADFKAGGIQTALRARNGELIQLLEGVSSTALKDAALANERTEAERRKRVQLQQAILHRVIPLTCVSDKCNFDGLKPFKGTKLLVEYAGDEREDPRNLASNVASFASNAKWDVPERGDSLKPAGSPIQDGITVQAYIGPNAETDASSRAADAFAAFLKSSGMLGVRRTHPKDGELPSNTVRLLIGFTPDPFEPDK